MHTSAIAALLSRVTLAVCTTLLAACAAVPGAGSPAKLALVIGNADYENAPALVNPTNDAADMCAALRRLGFRTLCHTNVRDRSEFDARMRDYVEQLGPHSVGVVYYSGHGVQVGSANFLIPTKAEPASESVDPQAVLYGVDELFERLSIKPPRFQLVILDACRTDLLAPAKRTASGRGVAAPAAPARPGLARSLAVQPRVGNGLAPIKDAPPGTMVLYATASNDAAYDGEGRNGPLTKHILAHIGTRGLTVEDFIKRVTRDVESETLRHYRKRQTPYTYGSFSGTFCFAGCPDEARVPIAN